MPHICVVRIKDFLNSINLFLLIYEYLPDSTTQGAWGHSTKCSNVLVPFRLNTRIWAGGAIHPNLGTAHRLWKLLLTPDLSSKEGKHTGDANTNLASLPKPQNSHSFSPLHFLVQGQQHLGLKRTNETTASYRSAQKQWTPSLSDPRELHGTPQAWSSGVQKSARDELWRLSFLLTWELILNNLGNVKGRNYCLSSASEHSWKTRCRWASCKG